MSDSDKNVTIRSIAVLGAGGTMGKGMARNAAAAEIPVHAWNRTAAKLDDLADTAGVRPSRPPARRSSTPTWW